MSGRQRWIGGIDEPLPEGEEILWRGSPDPRAVARHVVHERGWLLYLAILAIGVVLSAWGSRPVSDVVKLLIPPALLMLMGFWGMRAYARSLARNTEYIITTRRLVLRAGMAFPIAINIPLRLVDEAGVREFADGTGELQLRLSEKVKLAYIALWPHVETLRYLSHPRPKLRGLAAPKVVGAALRDAIAADAERDGSLVTIGAVAGHVRTSDDRGAFSAPNGVLAQ